MFVCVYLGLCVRVCMCACVCPCSLNVCYVLHARVHVVRVSTSAEVDVVAGVVVDAGLGKHGVVLNLGLLQGRAVGGNDDQPSLALAQCLERRLVAELRLAGLHDLQDKEGVSKVL